MKKGYLKIAVFAVFVLLTTFTFFACRKSFHSDSAENNALVIEAKAHLASLVESEQSLLSLPFSELKKTANLRRFARIEKLADATQWGKAQSFSRNATSYSIVPVDDDVHHLHNQVIESVRYLLFSKRGNDKMEMNIIELYSSKNGSLGTNLPSDLKTIVENRLFKERKPVENLTASIIFYDRYYYNVGSFITQSGDWTEAKIVVENTTKRPSIGNVKTSSVSETSGSNLQKSLLSSVSPMSGCQVCTTYVLIGIWYELDTGKIVDTEILDSWDECVEPNYAPQGSAPGTTVTSNLNPSTAKTINNNLTNPCMSSVLNAFKSKISDFVVNASGNENIYRPMTFNYFGVTDLDQDHNGGLTTMNQASDGTLIFGIDLNLNTLPSTSKEYIFRTLLHEALHGVLLSNGVAWNNLIQHDEIANYYLGTISAALRDAFPNLSTTDADALAWEGLGKSTAFDKLTQSKKDEIGSILNDYKNPSQSGSGTGC